MQLYETEWGVHIWNFFYYLSLFRFSSRLGYQTNEIQLVKLQITGTQTTFKQRAAIPDSNQLFG